MSDVTAILTSVVDIKRFTAKVVDLQAVVSSISPSRQPAKTARMEITINGGVYNNGLVSIAGTTIEQFSFTQDGFKVGLQDFSVITGITIAGINGGFIQVRAVSDIGQPVNQLTIVSQNLKVRLFQNSAYMKEGAPGQQVISHRIRFGMMMEPDGNIANNDYVYADYGVVGLTVMKVDFFEAIYNFKDPSFMGNTSMMAGATHHLEVWLTTI